MHTTLQGKQIVLGVSGGIAAYKSAHLLRLLQKEGAQVQVAMTPAACQFITPTTMQALSGRTVLTSLWHDSGNDGMAHIHATRGVAALVIAPATADVLQRAAQGAADDLLLTMIAARPHASCPVLFAAAMNHEMWRNPANQRAVEQLRAQGCYFVGPQAGEQACGEVGPGRMSEPEEIMDALHALLTPKCLAGIKLLITAGPTFEPIDPVRGLTNRSSGKMGYALARAAAHAGAMVTLVSGPTALPAPMGVIFKSVETAEQMLQAVQQSLPADIFIATAAVADWRPKSLAGRKLKKSTNPLTVLELTENPDILAWVSKNQPQTFCLGFAAETEDLVENARAKLQSKGVAMIAVNHGPSTFQQDSNELWLVDNNHCEHLPSASKTIQASRLIEALARNYHHHHATAT